jgi:hypothetical protein
MAKESMDEKMARMRAAAYHPPPKEPEEYRVVSDEEFTDAHDAFAKAYLEYFDAYFLYLERDSYRTYYSYQKKLREVIELAKLVQLDAQDNFYKERLRPGVRLQRGKNAK